MPDNTNGASRLDRIESILETLAQDHRVLADEHIAFRQDLKQLLTAQVVLTDRMNQLHEAQKHTGERLKTLIGILPPEVLI